MCEINIKTGNSNSRLLKKAYKHLLLLTSKIEKMENVLDDLKAKVAQSITVQKSAEALLSGLKSKLDAALAALASSGDTSALKNLSDELGAESSNLSAAITANTPADAPVTTTPPVETSPVDTTPVDSTPVDTTPVDTTPVETVPGDGTTVTPEAGQPS